jgi:hypothetical protein
MLSSKERILDVLESVPNGICDDCLSEQTQVRPRQQVNSICRSLSNSGKAKREKALCPSCNKIKVLNMLVTGEAGKGSVPSGLSVGETVLAYGAGERLDSIRREIIRTFNKIDPVKKLPIEPKETFSDRLARLHNQGKVPNSISVTIRFLNAFRNLAVYENCNIKPDELALIDEAWKLVRSWSDRIYNGQEKDSR